jgi:hypothetical protein
VTTPPREISALPPTVYRATTFVGVALASLYAIGFLVANAYYGEMWVVDPSLLQVRYAAAGVLWLLFLASSILPAHFLTFFWGSRTKRTDSSVAMENEFKKTNDSILAWLSKRNTPLRWLLTALLLLALITTVAPALILFLSPVLSVFLLTVLGANPAATILPALGFYAAVMTIAVLQNLGGIPLEEHLDIRHNPHRPLLLVCALVLHAVVFGHTVYPLVPASGGGARPLPARLVLAANAAPEAWAAVPPGTRTIESAYVVLSTAAVLVVLLPVDTSASGRGYYCPVALRPDQVLAVRIKEDVTSWLVPTGNILDPATWVLPPPHILRCR